MPKVNAKEFGRMILRALNIDAKFVRGFTIHVSVGEPVTIKLDRFIDLPQDDSTLASIFRTARMGRKLCSETFELEVPGDDKNVAVPGDGG